VDQGGDAESGGSVKDRIGITMIDEQKKGLLKPGGTIVEGTSGNTGMGLALWRQCADTNAFSPRRTSSRKKKVDLLKALGAEVIVCPRPSSRKTPAAIQRGEKLAREIPNAYYPNQYDNPCNPEAHYKTTGPEIWKTRKARSRTSFADGHRRHRQRRG